MDNKHKLHGGKLADHALEIIDKYFEGEANTTPEERFRGSQEVGLRLGILTADECVVLQQKLRMLQAMLK